ncbi:MAG TPA: hypothetical protein PL182_07225 [Pseudobdellovibrionaceae bacterium]|nr:hypothetical protein [Pseudobdellovibrionaceae bacterium]
MRTQMTAFAALILAAGLLGGCSSGFQGSSSTAPSAGSGNNGQGDGGTAPNPIQNLDLKGYINGGNYDETQTFDFDRTRGELIVRIPLGMDPSVFIGVGSIPQLPGVSFYTTMNSDGNYHFVMSIPVRYVLRGVTTLPSNRLPSGDPLPMMPAGELPSVAFTLNPNSSRKAYLYLGVDAVGLYVESEWLTCKGACGSLRLSFPIRNQSKSKVVGYFSLIGGKSTATGGVFISSIIPPEIARILDDYFL